MQQRGSCCDLYNTHLSKLGGKVPLALPVLAKSGNRSLASPDRYR